MSKSDLQLKSASTPAYQTQSHNQFCRFSTVTPEDFLNARAPYQFRILYEAFRPMDSRVYIPLLKRTVRSVNNRLIRTAGFPLREESTFQSKLQMIEGMVVLHGHDPKPQIEIVCNVNQQHCFFTPSAIAAVFVDSQCFESFETPFPLIDRQTVDVSYLSSGTWDDSHLQDIPYIFSLIGGRCHLEC